MGARFIYRGNLSDEKKLRKIYKTFIFTECTMVINIIIYFHVIYIAINKNNVFFF